MASDNLDAVVGSAMAIVRPVVSFIDPRFLMFSLTTTRFADYVASVVDHGNRSDTLSHSAIGDFTVPVPGMDEQIAILSVLDPLCRQHAELDGLIQDEIVACRNQATAAKGRFFERLEARPCVVAKAEGS